MRTCIECANVFYVYKQKKTQMGQAEKYVNIKIILTAK